MHEPFQTNILPPPIVPYPPPPTMLPLEPRNMLTEEREVWKLATRTNAEIAAHLEKTIINETAAVRLMEAREDLKLKRLLLTNVITIDSNGDLVRKQEFLRAKSCDFELCNFKITSTPLIYSTFGEGISILRFSALQQNRKTVDIFLNLQRTDPGYYWRKFRNAGLQIKKKRGERSEMIFQVIEVICGISEYVMLPGRTGFYITESGNFGYAGAEDLTWREVIFYAE